MTPADTLAPSSRTTRRKKNVSFLFDNRHPLFHTHWQRIRSKFFVPVLAGKPPPTCPTLGSSGKILHLMRENYAIYMLTLLSPWSERTNLGTNVFLPIAGTTWADFVQFVKVIEDTESTIPTPTFVNRCTSTFISNISSNLKNVPWMLKSTVSYRARACDQWANGRKGPCFEDTLIADMTGRAAHIKDTRKASNDIDIYDKDDLIAVAAIQELRNLANGTAAKEQRIQTQTTSYFSRALEDIAAVFDNITDPPFINGNISSSEKQHHEPCWQGSIETCKKVFQNIKARPEVLTMDPVTNIVDNATRNETLSTGIDVPTRLAQQLLSELPEAADPIPGQPISSLNRPTLEQYRALQTFASYIDAYSNYLRNPMLYPEPLPLRILIHGGPGTGKSFLLNIIKQMIADAHLGAVSSAFTGVAATIIPGSETLSTLFHLPPEKTKGTVKDIPASPLTVDQRTTMINSFENKHFVLIDEISMVGQVFLGKISQRLKEIAPAALCERDFGGTY